MTARSLVQTVRHLSLEEHAVVTLGISGVLVVVWALTSHWYFWPIHAILPLAVLLAIHGGVVLLERRRDIERRLGGYRPAVVTGVAATLWLYLVALWAEGGGGDFWPAWPLLGLAAAAGLYALVGPRCCRSTRNACSS